MVRRKDLTTEERNRCVQFILEGSSAGKPRRGRLQEAEAVFCISRATVSRLWRAAKQQQEAGLSIHLKSKKIGVVRKTIKKPNYEILKNLPVNERQCYRAMVVKMGVSRATLSRWGRAGKLRIFASFIKPSLTEENMFTRMKFSLDCIVLDRMMNQLRYSSMHNVVHIDEKWFFITKTRNRYYLAPDEEPPQRSCKSKRFIGKLMFMCAVSRPIINEAGTVLFDGKIGCFPFTTQEMAQKNSKNRKKGTLFTKAIESITKSVMKTTLLEKVLPAIRNKWPAGASKDIMIQQDNAKPHILDSDPDFREAASQDGFNIKLLQQPANSPDTNINDLGFFNAIQSLQHRRVCKTLEDLQKAVMEAFEELPPMTLNKVFLTLQGCLTEIMKVKGKNSYSTPHYGKDHLIREGRLPTSLTIPVEVVLETIQFLVQKGRMQGMQDLMHRLGLQEWTGLESQFMNTLLV